MSHHTEQHAIAALLAGGWHHGGHELTEDDFADIGHRKIFRAISELVEAGHEPDLFTVQDRVSVDMQPFAGLFGSAKTIGAYVETLKDESLHRRVYRALSAVLASDGTGREKLLEAQSVLASLESHIDGEVAPLKDHFESWWDELGQRAEGGSWLHTGFPDVDKRLGGMRGGDLIVIAGRPAMGKTVLALNIAQQCRGQVAFFSLEMTAEQLLDRLAARIGRIPLGNIRSGDLSEAEWSRLTEAVKEIHGLPIHVDVSASVTVQDIQARARAQKSKSGLDLVVIDYLQIMDDPGKNEIDRITNISKSCKRMAKDLDVPVILLSQLSRDVEKRADKRPVASDLRSSGAIEQDADAILMIYRDEVYNEHGKFPPGTAELLFRKVRQGQIGTEWLLFEGQFQHFKQGLRPVIDKSVRTGPYGDAA